MNKEEKERLRKSVGSLFERAQFHADFYDGGEMSDEIIEVFTLAENNKEMRNLLS